MFKSRNKSRNTRRKNQNIGIFGGGVDGPKSRWRDVMGTYHRTKKSRDNSNNIF